MAGSISVAMAVYNGAQYIEEQLDSILCQIDDNDEIIISYDKSQDNTWSIIKDYENKYCNVHVVENDDPGVFGNFENAIKNSTKDYIFITDQDDCWAQDKKKEVLACFERTGCDMVIHNGYHIDSKGIVISEDFFSMYGIKPSLINNYIKPRYSGCCTAFTREFSNIILPIPKSVGAYDHWIGMTGELMGKTVFLDKKLLYHRLHDNNVTPTSKRPLKVIVSARFHLACWLAARALKNRRTNVRKQVS